MKNKITKTLCVLCACAALLSGCGKTKIIKVTDQKADATGTQTAINYAYDSKVGNDPNQNSQPAVPKVEVSPAAKYFLQFMDSETKGVYKQLYSGLLSFSDSIDVTDKVVKKDDIGKLLEMCASSSPEITYIGQEYTVCIDTEDYVTAVNVTYSKTPAQANSERAALESKAEVILSGLSKKWGDYEKVKYFHDTIIQNCDYSEDGKDPYSAYGCLYDGKAVCEGYTKAMQYLCDKAGIECIPVTGKGKSGGNFQPHIWNKIKISGKWYCFDVTWDDPVAEFESGYVRYDYFAITDDEMSRDHSIEENPYMKYPEAVSKSADYFVKSKLYCEAASDYVQTLTNAINNAMMKKQIYARIKCSDKEMYDKLINEIFTQEDGSSAKIFNILSDCVDRGNVEYSKYKYSLIKNDIMYTITVRLSIN